MTLADTGMDTMTGGRVQRVEHHVKADAFIVTYGDELTDVEIRELLVLHATHCERASATTAQPVSRLGITMIDVQSHVTIVSEKLKLDDSVISR